MRIIQLFLAMTLFVLGCAAPDRRVAAAEQSVMHCEDLLTRVDESYDLSEQDIARMRMAVEGLVQRGRLAAYHLEMAARDYEYAAVHHHLASADFARASENYEIAAMEYEQIASLIITAASSKRLLASLCGKSAHAGRLDESLGAYRVNLDGQPLNLPLPVLKALAKRAAQMLLCGK